MSRPKNVIDLAGYLALYPRLRVEGDGPRSAHGVYIFDRVEDDVLVFTAEADPAEPERYHSIRCRRTRYSFGPHGFEAVRLGVTIRCRYLAGPAADPALNSRPTFAGPPGAL